MKVLFAVSNEEISEAIIKRYQKDNKQIISYKNVYYFNAILKEIQKDKTYDRIVISEDLEAFTHTQYDQIDKFIFDKLDSISDEASDVKGNDTPIILICSDRRSQGEQMLVKLFSIGIYDAIIGNDRSIEEVCRLIKRPRSKKEAKAYYKIDAEEVSYQPENENDVSEMEIQNILAHYKRLGKNEDRYIESFNNIAAQYNDTQLRVISNFLPLNVRAVLEEKSVKYQQIMSFNNSVSSKLKKDKQEKPNGPTQTLLKPKNKDVVLSKPIVIPSAMNATGVRKLSKHQNNNIQQQANTLNMKENVIPQQQINPIMQETMNMEQIENNTAVQQPTVKEQESVQPVKRGRGRPRKTPEQPEVDENVANQPKRGRGRPRKTEADTEPVTILPKIKQPENAQENIQKNVPENTQENNNGMLQGIDEQINSNILPGFEEQTNEDILPGLGENSNANVLPGIEEPKNASILPELESQDNFDVLPGIQESENAKITQNLSNNQGVNYNNQNQPYQTNNIPNPYDINNIQNLFGINNMEVNDVPNPYDVPNEQANNIPNPYDVQNEQANDAPNLFGMADEQEDNTQDIYQEDNVQNIYNENDSIEENKSTNPYEIEDETTNSPWNNNINNQQNQYENNIYYATKEPSANDNYVNTIDLTGYLTPDKKIVAFVGTSKNGTSFIVNNMAELLSSMGINTAILDTTQNKNSYYIYTKNEEELRKVAQNSFSGLVNGTAAGIKVRPNLTVYTSVPSEDSDLMEVDKVLETLLKNHSLVLIDCDFNTPIGYFKQTQELYLVQSLDILTIQPLTAFLRKLKAKDALDEKKIRIILNKSFKIKGITDKTIIGGMAYYNDPAMSYMTELFDRNMVKYITIPFDEDAYILYLEGIINCEISLRGYPKQFMQQLAQLGNMIYTVNNAGYQPPSVGKFAKNKNQPQNGGFSPNMNNTLEQMRKY